MRCKIFGQRSGLRVSELALGTGNFGTGWGHGAEPDSIFVGLGDHEIKPVNLSTAISTWRMSWLTRK